MPIKSAYYIPSSENIERLINCIQTMSGNKLKLSCIRQNIFKTKWTDREIKLWNRCQLQAANIFLKYILGNGNIREHEETVKTIIADIIPFIQELDKKIDTSFILCSTNTLPSTIHYKHAEWMFYHNQLPDNTNRRYDLDLLILYALRLALEKRIHGFLGIDFITIKNKPIPLSKIFPIIKNLKSIEYNDKIEWHEIGMVYHWLNHFMHRHIRPYPWVIHQAFEVLNPLLQQSKKTVDGQIYYSFYASTYVKDINILKDEIEHKILNQIPGTTIHWSNDKEILTSINHE